ncbi:MAG: hypothetical protein JSS25_04745, partial [Proteobacteria bacterium]|nr:hypothetical protein [Pseudomonadota bacterium]
MRLHHLTPPFLLAAMLCAAAPSPAQNAHVLIAEGDSLLAAGSAAKAMVKFNAALDLGRTAEAYAGRGRGWYFQGKYDKFLDDTRSALDLDSLNA